METQKAAPASLAGSGRLQRSSWKADAIRTGKLKISGPIPVVDEAGEDLTKRHTDPFVPPTMELPPQPPQQVQNPLLQHRVDGDLEGQDQRASQQPDTEESSGAVQHDRPATMRTPSQMKRYTTSNLTASYHSSTHRTSATESPNMTPKKKRRSGLRTVFRKMFGRKSSKDETLREEEISPPHPEPSKQESEVPVSEEPEQSNETDTPSRNTRIFSVPFQDMPPRTPLGSGLPFPMNVNAPEEISPPHEYLTFDENEKPILKVVPRRRATLPSIVFSSAEAAELSAYWGTNDASHEPQILIQRSSTAEPEIGIAVSSPRHLNRRSRSAGALQEMARRSSMRAEIVAPPRTPRRRSAEIRYWRSSGMDRSISVYSDSKTVQQKEEDGKNASGSTENASAAAAGDTTQLATEQIRAFNFGNLTGDAQISPELERTPTMTDHSTVDFEDTPFREEQNPQYMEHIVPTAFSRPQQAIFLEDAPKGRRSSREPSSSSLKGDSSSRTSSTSRGVRVPLPSSKSSSPPRPSITPIPSEPSSPDKAFQHQVTLANLIGGPLNDDMASHPSLSNLRGVPFFELHSPPDQKLYSPDLSDTPFPTSKAAEQFSAIYTILRHERAARKSLEKQVLTMQRELQELRLLTTKLASAASYPTPSPDAIQTTEDGGTIRLRPSQHHHHHQHHDHRHSHNDNDMDEDGYEEDNKRETVTSRFSRFDDSADEHDHDHDNANTATPSSEKTNGGISPEVFETPREESIPYGFGFGMQTARAVAVGPGEIGNKF